MESKQKKIAAFIESLPIDSNVGECESVLLSTNMNFMGGNGGDCTNSIASKCTRSENGGNCINTSSNCSKSKNAGNCQNGDIDKGINSQC